MRYDVCLIVVDYHCTELVFEYFSKFLYSEKESSSISLALIHFFNSTPPLSNLQPLFQSCANIDYYIYCSSFNLGYLGSFFKAFSFFSDDHSAQNYILSNPDISYPCHPVSFIKQLVTSLPTSTPSFMFGAQIILSSSRIRQSTTTFQNPYCLIEPSRLHLLVFSLILQYYYTYIIYSTLRSYFNGLLNLASAVALGIRRLLRLNVNDSLDSPPDVIYQVYSLFGAFIGVSESALYILSKIEPLSIIYGEELMLSKESQMQGIPQFFFPGLVLSHIENSTTSKVPSRDKWRYTRQAINNYLSRYQGAVCHN